MAVEYVIIQVPVNGGALTPVGEINYLPHNLCWASETPSESVWIVPGTLDSEDFFNGN